MKLPEKKHKRESSISKRKELGLTPKAQSIKKKIEKFDLIKIETFCSVKDLVKKMQITNQEKIFLIIYLTKFFYLEYIKNSQKPTLKKSPQKIGKIQEEMFH